MMKYEWKRVRLYGSHWWSGIVRPDQRRPDLEEKLTKQKDESEQLLTDLLNDGWQMVSVMPYTRDGQVSRAGDSYSSLLQEVWVVFLQRVRE